MTVGRSTVEKIIGEKLDGSPLADPNAGKNPAAVALGKLGGAKGGAARAAALNAIAKQLDGDVSGARDADRVRMMSAAIKALAAVK